MVKRLGGISSEISKFCGGLFFWRERGKGEVNPSTFFFVIISDLCYTHIFCTVSLSCDQILEDLMLRWP